MAGTDDAVCRSAVGVFLVLFSDARTLFTARRRFALKVEQGLVLGGWWLDYISCSTRLDLLQRNDEWAFKFVKTQKIEGELHH
jgi:hypothetical protein